MPEGASSEGFQGGLRVSEENDIWVGGKVQGEEKAETGEPSEEKKEEKPAETEPAA